MRLSPIIALISAQCPIFEGRVELLPDTLALDEEEVIDQLPMAFVCAFDEISGPSKQFKGTTQVEEYLFGVLVVAEGMASGSEPVEDARDQLKQALLGVTLYAGAGQIKKAGGSLGEIYKRKVSWWDLFTFSGVLSSAP